MPSYARFLHLYFLRDWRKHFHDLHKAITYVCRYGKQGGWAEVAELSSTDLWRRVRYISDALEKEYKAAKPR